MILGLTPFFFPIDHVQENHPSTFATGPKYSVSDKDDSFQVFLDVPGLKESDLKVLIHSNRIEVSCKQQKSNEKERKESTFWTRIFQVEPKTLDMDKARAILSDGVLTVSIPRKTKQDPKIIEILTDESTSVEMEKAQADDNFHVETFIVPGIRKTDLKIEVQDDGFVEVTGLRVQNYDKAQGNKKRTISYSKRVSIDNKIVDLQAMKAFLENGILTIFAPKKPKAEAIKIPIDTDSDSRDDRYNNANMFTLSIDIPGTKPGDVSVTCRDENIVEICGSRRHGGLRENMELKRLYMIDSEIVDVSKMKAYLADGVLTIDAPYLFSQDPRTLQIEVKSIGSDQTNVSKTGH